MSASKEKKYRYAQRNGGADKNAAAAEQAQKNKKFHRNTIITVLVIVVLVAAALVINSDLFYTRTTAVQVGNTKFSPAEVNYFYKSSLSATYEDLYSQFGDMTSMILDPSASLRDQPYTDDQTWADVIYESAESEMKRVAVYYDAAIQAGYQLTDEDKSAIEADIADMYGYAEENGFLSVDKFLAAYYGKGMSEKIYTNLLEKVTIAANYSTDYLESLSYTDDQLKTYYAEHAAELNCYNYYFHSVNTTDEKFADLAEDAKAAAAHDAAAEIATAVSPEDFVAKVNTFHEKETPLGISSVNAGSLSDSYKDWMTDTGRKFGDTTVVDTATSSYAIMFLGIEDNNYYPVDMRHILIKAEADENGNYTDEALAAAKEGAEAIYNEWKFLPNEESVFATLANEYSEDEGSNTNGGLYSRITKYTMVSEINDFLFDPSRAAGDTAIVYGNNGGYAGYHIVYYVGANEQLYSDYLAQNALTSADFSAHYEALAQGYEVVTNSALKFANIT